MSGPLPFDPVERASDSWAKHYPEAGEQVYAAMRAVTSIMRAQQILIAGLDASLRPFGLTFAEVLDTQRLGYEYATAATVIPVGGHDV